MFYETGINKYCTDHKFGTIHAEVDALIKFSKKFNKIQTQTSNKNFYICVFTTNKRGDILRHSECCDNCIKSIHVFNKKNKFNIIGVYSINIDWEITYTKF